MMISNAPGVARTRIHITVIAVLVAVMSFGSIVAISQRATASSTASISGFITEPGATGVNYTTLDVTLTLPGGTYVDDVTPDSTGAYSFTGLVAANYRVEVADDYATGYLGQNSGVVSVADGQALSGVNVALTRGATVSGVVSSSSGVVANATVSLALQGAQSYGPGDKYGATTGSDGSFSFEGIPGGSYTIWVQGPYDGNLADQFWSGQDSFATANFFDVAEGQTVSGKNFTLQPGATISGTVTGGPTNTPTSSVSVSAYLPDGTGVGFATTGSDGQYTISGLAPGSYTLDFSTFFFGSYAPQWWSGAQSQDTAQYFSVPRAANLSGYNAVLTAGATINGAIVEPNGHHFGAWAYVYDSDGSQVAFASESDSSGSYSLSKLAAGDYTVNFASNSGTSYADNWWNGASTATDATVIHVASGQQVTGVNATLTAGATISGTITGLAYNGASFPAANATVTAYLSDGSEAGSVDADIDGTYSISNLAAGTYLLKIEPQGDTTDFQSAWYLNSSSQASATAVTVTTGQALTGIDDTLPSSSTTSGVTTAGGFDSLAPFRLLDTRSGVGAPTGAVAPNGVVSLQVTGRGGVPATGVSAVVLNVTVAEGKSPGFITVYGDGTTRPTASNLNFGPGQIVPNLVVAPVGADGKVDLYNGSSGTTQIIADVAGYYLSGTPSDPGTFGALAPARLLDTRSGVGAPTGAVAPNGVVSLQVTGRGGVPATGVSAVVLNVTVAEGKSPGFVTVYGDGTTRPTASNLNFGPGQIVPNLVVAPVGADGKVDLYNGSSGTTQIIADVAGYYLSGTPSDPGTFGALAPARLLDTRSGVGAPTGAVAPNGVVSLQVTGRGGVPATGVSAVVLNVTVAEGKSPGFITVYGDGTTRPTASNLNFGPGQIVPNLVVAPVGADGKVDLYNGSSGTTQIIADVAGWFTAAP